MVFRLTPWACYLALLTHALPIASGQVLPKNPSTDAFYQPPAGFESKAPGTILRTRTVDASFLGLVPDVGVETHQLLHRTTAINGSATTSVTTVFKPINAKLDRFVSFHTAYDGSATICDPSYNYQLGAEQADMISDVEMLLLQAFLISGYIVSSPDYEGPEAAFSVGRLEGMGVLDSMRAVTQFKDTLGLSTNEPKIVGYGYSGGAIATGWAASLHASYAPELPIQGWAQGGTPANLTGTLLYLDNTVFSGFLPASVVGLSKATAYGAVFQPLIQSIVTPYGQSVLDFAAANCGVEDLFDFPGQSILAPKFQSLGSNLLYDPTVVSILEQNTMGLHANETPSVPIYLYHAQKDEIIPYANATTLVDSWCQDGGSVVFTTFGNGGHFTTEILGFVGAFQFIEAAFAGTASVGKGCSRKTVLSNTLNPLALGVDLEPVLVDLLNALLQFGEGDANVINNIQTLNKTL